MKSIFLLVLSLPMFGRCEIDSLYYFTRTENLPAIKRLVQGGADLNAAVTYGWTPLQEAAWNGSMDIVQYLADKGANLNAQDVTGASALLDAVWANHPDIAKYLILKGADVNAQMPGHVTVYGVALEKNETEIVQMLEARHAKKAPTYP